MGEANLHSTEKVRENTEISHSLLSLVDLEFTRTHGIPDVCECTSSHKMEIFCENHIIPRLWVFEEDRSYYETQIIHRVWVM